MVIKRTIDKETVKDLPKAAFPGQIHVVQTPWEAEKAVAYLKSCPLLGIDSETRPSFTKGQIPGHQGLYLRIPAGFQRDDERFACHLPGKLPPPLGTKACQHPACPARGEVCARRG